MIRVNRSHPLNRGRLSWWLGLPHLAGGTLLYDIVGNNHATIIGAPPWTRGFSNFDAAVKLAPNLVTPKYATAACPTLSAYTLALRVTFDDLRYTPGSYVHNSLLKNWGATLAGYFHWNMLSGADGGSPGQIRCVANATGGMADVRSIGSLSAGVPYHLAVAVGGGSIRLYTDGKPDGSGSYSGTLASGCSRFAFGCKLLDDQVTPDTGPVYEGFLAGTLGDVSLWDRALSDAEVAQLYAESRAGYPGMLIRGRALLPNRPGRFRRLGVEGGFPADAGGF